MFAYKFQVFIIINMNSIGFFKLFHDSTEMNNTLNLINEDIYNFVLNNF